MRPELMDRLHEDLNDAGYASSSVSDYLGEVGNAARERGNVVPARRRIMARERTPLATLIRVFLLGDPAPPSEVSDALPRLRAEGAEALGLIEQDESGRVRAALALNPVRVIDSLQPQGREWWIISDLDDHIRRGPARADHVMGVGGATRSLIAQLPPRKVDSALDLGTGSGIVALHLAFRGPVVATDISSRALAFARANARLNRVSGIDFRQGDLYVPVRDDQFDLIAANPPFVISPPAKEKRYAYRESSFPGDQLAEHVIVGSAQHLRPGGEIVALANWEYPWGEDGLTRVKKWVEAAAASVGEDIDGWIVERDRVDPAQYAEVWARDAGLHPGEEASDTAIDAMLADFSARRIVQIGLGTVRMRRAARSSSAQGSVIRAERAVGPQHYESLGRALDAAFAAGSATARLSDSEILEMRWRRPPELREIREHRPGEDAPHAMAIETSMGIERRITADTLLSAAVGASDGELTLGQIADALATLLEVDAGPTREALVQDVRELTWMGVLRSDGK